MARRGLLALIGAYLMFSVTVLALRHSGVLARLLELLGAHGYLWPAIAGLLLSAPMAANFTLVLYRREPPLTARRSYRALAGALGYLVLFAAAWKAAPAYSELPHLEQLTIAFMWILVAVHVVIGIASAVGVLVHAWLALEARTHDSGR